MTVYGPCVLWPCVLWLVMLLPMAWTACPVDWTTINSNCYKVFNQSQSFAHAQDARALCVAEGGDMASVPFQSVADALYGQLQAWAVPPQYVYIGSFYNGSSYSWLDNTTYSFSNFTGNGTEACGALCSASRQWSPDGAAWCDVPCCMSVPRVFSVACSRPEASNVTLSQADDVLYQHCFAGCPDTSWRRHGSNCYKSWNTTSSLDTAHQARDTCLSQQADLPDVTSLSEELFISRLLSIVSEGTSDAVYLGINNITTAGDFATKNGIPLANYNFSNWETGSPLDINSTTLTNHTNCCILTSSNATWAADWKWRNVDCCTNIGVTWVLCEKPLNTAVTYANNDNNVFATECFAGVNECDSNPCQNNATCSDEVAYFNCTCLPGYNGTTCSNQIDLCSSAPCQNGAPCVTEVNGYTCTCPAGHTGQHCETMTDACISDPCQNNATCVTGAAGYNCTCALGFDGVLCETNIDSCLNLTCINNGTCVDGVGSAHCNCPSSHRGTRCQTLVECFPAPPIVNNGSITRNDGNRFGDKIVLQCNPGFKFANMMYNRTLTCITDGNGNDHWDNMDSRDCEAHCDTLPYVANADVINANTRIGNTVNFTCDTGFRFPDNSTEFNVTCLSDGNWTVAQQDMPQCEIVQCPALPVYVHQDSDTRNTSYNTTIVFWCHVGYVLHDNTTARTIRCKADGKWTADLPECQPIKCPRLRPPASWSINTNDTANVYNTYARYACQGDKRMLDGATYRIIKCDATGEWSDNITDCTASRCFPLLFVANATTDTTDANYDVIATLTCIKGHRFNPGKLRARTMHCQHNGWWNPVLSACEPIYCPAQPTALHTTPSTGSLLYSTVVDFTCDTGYYYYPDMYSVKSIECLENENWNSTDIPDCWPIVCPAPPTIMNGTWVLPANHNYTAVVGYDCETGFKFIDGRVSKNIVCNQYGRWNESDVSCRVDRCSPVPMVSNTSPDTTNTSWYTNVTYMCNLGYEWPNNKSRHHITCQNDGQWNDTNIPVCTIKECVPAPVMTNATRNGTQFVYNTFIEYRCDTGYKYDDNSTAKTRWCSPKPRWDPPNFPQCNIIHCPELIDIQNATRDSNDTYYDHTVTYSCLPGYQFPDKSRQQPVTCTANETWTQFPPDCEVVFCPPVPWWTDTVFNTTENEFHSVVSYWCTADYAFSDSLQLDSAAVIKSSTCLEAKVWSPAIDDCRSRTSIAAGLKGKRYEAPEAVSIGTVAVSILGAVVGAIVLLDINKVVNDCKMMKNNLKHLRKTKKVSDSSTCLKG